MEKTQQQLDAVNWLQCFWQQVRVANKEMLMEKQNFPVHVQKYIETHWVRVNDAYGGIYEEPEYHKNNQILQSKFMHNQTNVMDENNKKAMEIMNTQSMEKAVEYMFTHPQTGKPMSYGEMRYFYG